MTARGKNKLKPMLLAEPVLVGRERELEQLHSLLDLAIKGKGNTVFVAGEAGVGKTRLINEFLSSAKKQAVTILTGWCLSNVAVPYFPFFEAFRKYFATETGTKELDIANLFMVPPQSLRPGSPQIITPQIWKDQTFIAIASTLVSISKEKPVILFIDDSHWADSASCALLHYLANVVNSEKILLIAIYRTEHLADSNNERRYPLVDTLRLMRRQDLIKEINILNLDENGVSNLARSMLSGDLQQEFTDKLTKESLGNPLFIVESIRMLNESRCIIQENDKWRLTGIIQIPLKIKDIILQRLESLSGAQRDVLEAAAVIGGAFNETVLSAVLERESIEIIKILDSIAKYTSLVHCAGELYSFDHARTRETVYEEISAALRRGYHAKVAQKLESISKDKFGDITYHYTQAGNKSKAVQFALAAGQDALSKWSNVEAIEHFSFVIQTVGTNPQYAHDKMVAMEGLGDAYNANSNFSQAIESYEKLTGTEDGTDKLRALRKAIRAASYLGDTSKQKTLIEKAETIANASHLEMGRIIYEKGTVAGSENDAVNTFKLTEEALTVFEEENALIDAAPALCFIGYVSASLGHLETAVVAALRSIAMNDVFEEVRSKQIEAYSYAGGTFQTCTFDEISNQMLAKAIELSEETKIWDFIRIIPAYVWWSFGLIDVDSEKSVTKALKALEYSEKTDAKLYTGAMYQALIMAYALLEDHANVDKYFAKFSSMPKHIMSNGVTQIYLGPAMGTYFAAKADFEKSNQYFSQSLVVAQSFYPNPFFEVLTRRLFAWALDKQGRAQEAKQQTEKAQGVITHIREEFGPVNIQSRLITLAKPEVNQTFDIRIDFVNASSNQGSIVQIENLLFPGLEIQSVSKNCSLEGDHITFKDNKIDAFSVKTLKITAQATKVGEFNLTPTLVYINNLGQTIRRQVLKVVPKLTIEKTGKTQLSNILESIKINVQPSSMANQQIEKNEASILGIEFKDSSAQETFDFLLGSFVQDYMNRRLPLELSGWRTFTSVVKNAKISRRMVYGSNGLNGRAILELERRGLVEVRVFPGERGRGGLIRKVRVCYEKEPIERLVDERVRKPVKKH